MLAFSLSLSVAPFARRCLGEGLARRRNLFPAAIMSSPVQIRLHSYDEAITALNGLQTNAKELQKIRKDRQRNLHLNLPKTQRYLEESGLSLDRLDKVKIIHVSGTKGKGSTCAFTESILQQYGLKTGFFSSPHLVTATERIRINGKPLGQEKFTSYFWSVFDRICSDPSKERPPYFQFLTILAFNVFVREEVDVAIVECGIGGTYDNTNVIRAPYMTGITSQGIDHKSILGSTIAENCSHKAGIMKPGAPAFVDHSQPPEAMEVIHNKAKEVGTTVHVVPKLEEYDWGRFPSCALGLPSKIQLKNAAIALQMARHVVSDSKEVKCDPFQISLPEALGLRLCVWPGRSQTVRLADDVTLFLDGAHTKESASACADWFKTACQKRSSVSTFRVLLFNVYDERQGEDMLRPLLELGLFDFVVFCTNFARRPKEAVSDNINLMATLDGQVKKCHENQKAYEGLQPSVPSVIIPYLNDALAWISQDRRSSLWSLLFSQFTAEVSEESPWCEVECELPPEAAQADQLQVLVTGSTHLVGGVLEMVRPDVFEFTEDELDERNKIKREYQELAGKEEMIC